jgi:hypothetical protein
MADQHRWRVPMAIPLGVTILTIVGLVFPYADSTPRWVLWGAYSVLVACVAILWRQWFTQKPPGWVR